MFELMQEDRSSAALPGASAGLAEALLDEMDYPVLLVTAALGVLFQNKTARHLAASLPIATLQGRLHASDEDGQAHLAQAIDAAVQRGMRSLITLHAGTDAETFVAVIPVSTGSPANSALLILPKPRVCQELTLDWYARDHKLTPGETRVLRGLCAGQPPDRIAHGHGVAVSTVRSQIASLLAKTGLKDLRALTRTLARLPPLVNALRVC